MTRTIIKDEYRNHDGSPSQGQSHSQGMLKTLVLTVEEEMSEPEIGQQIANLWYHFASVKSQLIANPNNPELLSQIDKINNDISVYMNYLKGFEENND